MAFMRRIFKIFTLLLAILSISNSLCPTASDKNVAFFSGIKFHLL